MTEQNKVTGVVLAGGLARRMNNQDKGLVLFRNKPMIGYAVDAMKQVANPVYINANRNQSEYSQFNCQVIADQTDTFDGPLAGVYAAMMVTSTDILLVMPCDSPLIEAKHLQKLLDQLDSEETDIAVAFDGERLHPVFLAVKMRIKSSLKQYLNQGNRKIDIWLKQHPMVKVDFSDDSKVFLNINTLSELQSLEKKFNG